MVKGNTKEKKAALLAAEKEADIKLYRLMVEFLFAVVALFLTVAAGNNEIFVLYRIMPIFLAVSGVLFGLFAVLFCVRHAKGVDESMRVITSAGLFGNAAVLFFLSCAYYLFMSAELVIGALIAITVVYMAYNVNGAGFFAYSVITAASYIAFSVAGCKSFYLIGTAIAKAAGVISFVIPALAIVLAVVLFIKKDGIGVLGIKIKGALIAAALLITAAIALVGAVVALTYPAAAALVIYGMLAFYFVATVIGVFKMM